MPSIRQYEYFATLARTLHFGRAADELNVAQPAMSAQLKAMEEELGVVLFDRDRRNVALSAAGALLLPDAEALLRQFERTRQLGKRVASGEAGSLQLAYVGSAALGGIMARIIHEFQIIAPKVQLHFVEMDMDKQLEEIATGRLDGGFIRLPLPPDAPDFDHATIQSEEIVVALRKDHPLATREAIYPKDLRHERFILTHLEPHMGFAAQIHMVCASAGFVPIVGHRARQFSIIVNLVAAGQGIALVPVSMQRFDFPEIVYRPIIDIPQRSEVALIVTSSPNSPVSRSFLKLAQEWNPGGEKQKGILNALHD